MTAEKEQKEAEKTAHAGHPEKKDVSHGATHTDAKKDTKAKQRPVSKKQAKVVKKKSTYKMSRSSEAKKMAREKSRLEKKKSKFRRQNFGKKVRVADAWRKSYGIDSGQRKQRKNKLPVPKAGYMTAQSVKGLHASGYFPIRVFNVSDLDGVDNKTQAALIASVVGKRKRAEIQKVALEKKIQILNHKE